MRDNFDIRVTNQKLSAFETVIRFLGGLMGAYRMSGDYMFVEKAVEVAKALDPAFNQSPFPAAHVRSGSTYAMKIDLEFYTSCRFSNIEPN